MFVVVIDSTELVSDFLFRHASSVRVQQLAADGLLRVRIPSVVVSEVQRRYREGLSAAIESASDVFDGRYGSLGLGDLSEARAAGEAAIQEFPRHMDRLLNHPGFRVLPHDQVDATALIDRDLAERRPFRKLKDGTVGMRDAIIWETTLGLIPALDEDDILVFVSNNTKDFYSEGGLHGHLLADLRDAGLPRERFFAHRTLKDFLEQHFPDEESRTQAESLVSDDDPTVKRLLSALVSDTPARARLLSSLLRTATNELTGVDLVAARESGVARSLWLDTDYAEIRVANVYGPYEVRVSSVRESEKGGWDISVVCHFDLDLMLFTEEAVNFLRSAHLRGADDRIVADLGATTVTARLHGITQYTSEGPDFDLTLTALADLTDTAMNAH